MNGLGDVEFIKISEEKKTGEVKRKCYQCDKDLACRVHLKKSKSTGKLVIQKPAKEQDECVFLGENRSIYYPVYCKKCAELVKDDKEFLDRMIKVAKEEHESQMKKYRELYNNSNLKKEEIMEENVRENTEPVTVPIVSTVEKKKRGRKPKAQLSPTENGVISVEPIVEKKKRGPKPKVSLSAVKIVMDDVTTPVVSTVEKKKRGRPAKSESHITIVPVRSEITKRGRPAKSQSTELPKTLEGQKKRGPKPKSETKVTVAPVVAKVAPVTEKKKRGRPPKRGWQHDDELKPCEIPIRSENERYGIENEFKYTRIPHKSFNKFEYTRQAIKLLAKQEGLDVYQENGGYIVFGDDDANVLIHLENGKTEKYFKKRPKKYNYIATKIESILNDIYQKLLNNSEGKIENYCSSVIMDYDKKIEVLEADTIAKLEKSKKK